MTTALLTKRMALYALKAVGAFWIARRVTRRKLRILCYHGFSIGDQHAFAPILFMRREVFRGRMALLRSRNFRVVTLTHGLALLRSDAVHQGEVVITIDDGWKSTLNVAAKALMDFGLPACLYITTYYAQRPADVFNVVVRYLLWKTELREVIIDGVHPAINGRHQVRDDPDAVAMNWINAADQFFNWQQRQDLLVMLCRSLALDPDQVLEQSRFSLLDEAEVARCRHFGIDVQLHTHRHSLPADSFDAMAFEVNENRRVLELAKKATCTHMCYPSGVYDSQHVDWLRRIGVDSATTCDPGLNSPSISPYLLKRHLDRDDASDIEFEAELCGVTDIARIVRSFLTGSEQSRTEPTLA